MTTGRAGVVIGCYIYNNNRQIATSNNLLRMNNIRTGVQTDGQSNQGRLAYM